MQRGDFEYSLVEMMLSSRATQPKSAAYLIDLIKATPSQLGGDLFALMANEFRTGGYFVEFGAADGIRNSNSWLLEKRFGWSGVLAEPARIWHENLESNRVATILKTCVWSESGKALEFIETNDAELSTLARFANDDSLKTRRKSRQTYMVPTLSLLDLLEAVKAPSAIDFLSVDSEGSEYEILSVFDFSSYQFNAICVEHSFRKTREPLRRLLEENGYVRVFGEVSQWDDWYLSSSIAGSMIQR